jgi:hypothetical protein
MFSLRASNPFNTFLKSSTTARIGHTTHLVVLCLVECREVVEVQRLNDFVTYCIRYIISNCQLLAMGQSRLKKKTSTKE